MSRIPTAKTLLTRARKLEPLFASQALAGEEAGRLTADTVTALSNNGFLSLMMPRVLGGTEAGAVEALEVIEALSYADASTGWVFMAWQVAMASAAAYLPHATSKKLFGEEFPLIAGQGGALGRADVVRGGYRLSGNWRYGSGLLHAAYIHTGAIVYRNGRPRLIPGTQMPEGRIFIVPVADAELKANWDVLGLRATGSIDYSIKDLFVPEEFTHLQAAHRPVLGGDFYRIGIPGMGTIGHSGFALGLARRVLDELAAFSRQEPSRSALLPQPGGGESFREQFALAEGRFRAARALVREAQGAIQDAVRQGRDPAVRETTVTRLALNLVTSTAAEICAMAYKFGGGASLRNGLLQRSLRDMCAATQHSSVAPALLRECARDFLGLAPGKIWGARGLIDPPAKQSRRR